MYFIGQKGIDFKKEGCLQFNLAISIKKDLIFDIGNAFEKASMTNFKPNAAKNGDLPTAIRTDLSKNFQQSNCCFASYLDLYVFIIGGKK